LFWTVVGHPAVSLGVRFAFWDYSGDIVSLYKDVVLGLTLSVVTTDTSYIYPRYENGVTFYGPAPVTPLLFRLMGGGVCGGYAWSTAVFAGAIGGYVSLIYLPVRGEGHALSVLILGDGKGSIDLNGDDVGEAIVLYDTAHLSVDYINDYISKVHAGNILPFIDFYYPVSVPVYQQFISTGVWDELLGGYNVYTPLISPVVDYYAGVYDAILGLPDWLKAPWLNYTMTLSNLTGVFRLADEYADEFAPLREVYEYVEMSVRNLGRSNMLPYPPSLGVLLNNVVLDYSGVPSVKVPLPECGIINEYLYFSEDRLHGIDEVVLPSCPYSCFYYCSY